MPGFTGLRVFRGSVSSISKENGPPCLLPLALQTPLEVTGGPPDAVRRGKGVCRKNQWR